MAKRKDLKKIMIIGSGPIIIGQAAEFDYAGTQACLALKEEGYQVVLCNSNPATIMTDKKLADAIYLEPLTQETLRRIIEKERPDGLLMIGPHVTVKLSDLKLPPNALVIVTEAIEKPGNLGTILRSADAGKVAAVIVCDRTTDIHNPNVVRASTGTMFSVPIVEAKSEEALEFLKKNNFKILAATPHAEKLHFEEDLSGNVAIALGAEQYGLTAKWMDGAELRVRIPMLGLADSLNVSAAATILVYEAVRQRIAAGIDQVPVFVPWHGEGAHDH